MENEKFSQYVEDYIKTHLENETGGSKIKKYKTNTIIYGVLSIFSILIFIGDCIYISYIQNDSFIVGLILLLIISIAATIAFIVMSVMSFRKTKNTSSLNVDKVLSNLDEFVSKYIEFVYPEIELEKFELKLFGGGEFSFKISNVNFHCDTDIKEVVKYKPSREVGHIPIIYFENSVNVIAKFAPIKIENNIKLKIGSTTEKNIDGFRSESTEFNKTYKVISSKEDGFNFFTPLRIESLMNNKHLIRETELNINGDQVWFSKVWEIQKTYNRKESIASKPLIEMSADNIIMQKQIIKHVQEIVENPIKNWKIIESLLLEK